MSGTGGAADPTLSMALPPALQPWRQWLVWFPPELAGVLGDLLRRLQPLLGPPSGRHRQAQGEPEGVDGLHTRGPYERLLASEWLLSQELPDEFMRRAAAGEHLFLAPRHATPQLDRQIVALFDAGPLQLGAPRLVHIAWWILLARRAAQAGAVLRWGFVQTPGVLHEARQANALDRLRRGRSFTWADAGHWSQWQESLAASTADPTHEHWWIGASPASVAPPSDAPAGRPLITHVVQVCRGLHGDSLSLTVTQHGQSSSLALDLPPATEGALLLQGAPAPRPRQAMAGADDSSFTLPDRLALTRAPVWSTTGSHVAVLGAGGGGAWVAALHDRSARKRRGPRWEAWAARAQPLSLFFVRKQLAGLLHRADTIDAWKVPHLGTWKAGSDASGEGPRLPPGTSRWLPAVNLPSGLCLLDAAGGLWLRAQGAAWAQVDSGVVGLLPMGTNVVYVTASDTHWAVRLMGPGDGLRFSAPLLVPAGKWASLSSQAGCARAEGLRLPARVSAVYFSLADDGALGGCAARLWHGPGEQWQLVTSGQEPATLSLARGWRVLGLVSLKERRHELLCLADDGVRLFRVDGARGTRTCYTAPARVVSGNVCPVTGRVALLTAARQLIVFDTRTERLELMVHSAGESEEADE